MLTIFAQRTGPVMMAYFHYLCRGRSGELNASFRGCFSSLVIINFAVEDQQVVLDKWLVGRVSQINDGKPLVRQGNKVARQIQTGCPSMVLLNLVGVNNSILFLNPMY